MSPFPRLGKRKVAALTAKAKRLGLTPQRYLRQLIEDDLALDRQARMTTFAERMGPGRDLDERELDRLVDAARRRHHQRVSR